MQTTIQKYSNALRTVRRGNAVCANTLNVERIGTGFMWTNAAYRRIMCNRQTHTVNARRIKSIASSKVAERMQCVRWWKRMKLGNSKMQLSQCFDPHTDLFFSCRNVCTLSRNEFELFLLSLPRMAWFQQRIHAECDDQHRLYFRTECFADRMLLVLVFFVTLPNEDAFIFHFNVCILSLQNTRPLAKYETNRTG